MERKTYEIKFHETDCKNRLKVSVLLNFMQDMAASDAENIGFGYSKIKDKNIGWFLTKYHIKLFTTIKGGDKITIETESKGALRAACIRDFYIFNENNEKIGEASSSWILADLETEKIILASSLFDNIVEADKTKLMSKFPKIPSPSKTDFKSIRKAAFSELDVNRHVNNSIYYTWANDTLPFDVLLSAEIKELEIQYKHQVKYDENVVITTDFNKSDNGNFSALQEIKTENDDTVCIIRQSGLISI